MKKHKKKRESKKHPRKKKRETKKQFNIKIFFLAILIIILFLIFINNKKVQIEEEKTAAIENLIFNEIPNSNRGWLSFYIRNDYNEYADCSATLFLNNDSFSWNVGIIKPNSRKLVKKSIMVI